MVIFDFERTQSGRPAAVITAVGFFFTLAAYSAVSDTRIEFPIRTVIIERAEGVDGVRDIIDQPVHQVKVVTGFVDGKTAGVGADAVPTFEIA